MNTFGTRFYVLLLISGLFSVAISSQDAFAISVTDASGILEPSSTVDFSQFSPGFTFTTGPVQVGGLVGEDITWSSNSAGSAIGDGNYGLGGASNNGLWTSARIGFVGTNLVSVSS